MPPRKPGKHPPARPPADLEEIRPLVFLIHNPAVHPVIKGEGTIEGKKFELTTWRREGLFARLEYNGFAVLTLEMQIDLLPTLPPVDPVDLVDPVDPVDPLAPPDAPEPAHTHPVSRGDRYSRFDPATLGWTALESTSPDSGAPPTLALLPGWIIRRRKGRGPASYYQMAGGRLMPLDETEALLRGYAQAAHTPQRPLLVTRQGESYLLPALELPAAYRALLKHIGQPANPRTSAGAGWQVDAAGLPLAQQVYARLGVALRLSPPAPESGYK